MFHCAGLVGLSLLVQLQTLELYQHHPVDSGVVQVPEDVEGREVVWSHVVRQQNATWLRLNFSAVQLDDRSLLRVESLQDGAVQQLNHDRLVEWQNTSAYFNGDAVRIDLLAGPGSSSRVQLAGLWTQAEPGLATTICFDDERSESSDPRLARLMPILCTGFLIDDPGRNFLTAGHCSENPSLLNVAQFNVPPSDVVGNPQHPDPIHQYAIDTQSIQNSPVTEQGEDWTHFACFRNTESNLKPWQAQGAWFDRATATQPADQRPLRIIGYGTVDAPLPPELSWMQKRSEGLFLFSFAYSLSHNCDTMGGDSGSPIIDATTGDVLGIHTNGGCTSSGGFNSGMWVTRPELVAAISNPQGEAIPETDFVLSLVAPLPDRIDAVGATIDFKVQPIGSPMPSIADLSVRLDQGVGAGFEECTLVDLGDGVVRAALPALPCGATVGLYFEARNLAGEPTRLPEGAPAALLTALVANDEATSFSDDFQTDQGWTVENGTGLIDGGWTRGAPAGYGDRGDPVADADGSGSCWLTDNVPGNSDVDGGPTTLLSPSMAVGGADHELVYARWFYDGDFENQMDDFLLVEISGDGGTTWSVLENYQPPAAPGGGWEFVSFPVSSLPLPQIPTELRMRVSTSDVGLPSVIEAGLDGVRIRTVTCDNEPVPGDVNGDGAATYQDLLLILGAWGPCSTPCATDLDDDGVTGYQDLLVVLANWFG